ncbi:hypothetical protein HXX76_002072 [Chlamydomonas incerta]|uniref:ERD4-related membrane protein n=1 Tax=Chlamydomonas incerta TaxID=51695 RepID=A0A835WAD8_CHLIN|nr:hypothetical protein HXX76_002072 [Chlamydomonas incerta]|eukprot:KAG2443726.1 hypothetical protein HXX76_002072 [Chlamydomonas incerta]
MAILGICVLIPLHWTGGEAAATNAQHSDFMRLTMANIMAKSKRFWVHFVFIYVYLGWAMLLLQWHYHQYLTIRQHYLRKGDANLNVWRTLYHEQPRGVGKEQPVTDGERVRGFLANVPLIKALLPTGVNVDADANELGVRAPSATSSDDDNDTFPTTADVVGASPTGARPSPSRVIGATLSRLHMGAGGLGRLSVKRPAAVVTNMGSVTGPDLAGTFTSQPPDHGTPARRVHSKFPWSAHGAAGDRLADEQLMKQPPPSYLTRLGSRRIAHMDRSMLGGNSEFLSAVPGAAARRRASATGGHAGGLGRVSVPMAVSGNLAAEAADAGAGAGTGAALESAADRGGVEDRPSQRRMQRNSQSLGPRMLAGGWGAGGAAATGHSASAGAGMSGGSPPGVDGWLASARQLVSQGTLGGGKSVSKGPALVTVQSGKESMAAGDASQPIAEANESGAAGADPAAAARGAGVATDTADATDVLLDMLPETPNATGRAGSAMAAGFSRPDSGPLLVSMSAVGSPARADIEAGHGADRTAAGGALTHGNGNVDGAAGGGGDGAAANLTKSSALSAPSGPSMSRSSTGGSSASVLDFLRWWEPPVRVRAGPGADVSRQHVAASRSGHASDGETSHDEGVVTGVPLRILGAHRPKTEEEELDGSDAAGQDEFMVSRSRPSVSYRKTVNAVYADGTWEAVLAQHYAVLVTDVKELPPRKHKETNKKTDDAVNDEGLEASAEAGPRSGGPNAAAVNAAAGRQVSGVRPKARRMVSFLPSCLVSWCTFGYGTQAASRWLGIGSARGGATGSVAGSEESFTRLNVPSSNGPIQHAITFGAGPSSFHSSFGSPAHHRHSGSGANAAVPPGHRRTRSGGGSVGGSFGAAGAALAAAGSFGSGGAGLGAGAYGVVPAAQHLGPGALGAVAGPGGYGTPRQLSQQQLQQGAAATSQRALAAAAAANAAAASAAGAVAGPVADAGVPLPPLVLPSIDEQPSLPLSPNGTGMGALPTEGAGPVTTDAAAPRHKRTPSAPRSADFAAGAGASPVVTLPPARFANGAGGGDGSGRMVRASSNDSLGAAGAAAAFAGGGAGSAGRTASGKSPRAGGAAQARAARFGSAKPRFMQLLEQMVEQAKERSASGPLSGDHQQLRPGSADPTARARAPPLALASPAQAAGRRSGPSSRASSGRGLGGAAAEGGAAAGGRSSQNGMGAGGGAGPSEPQGAQTPGTSRFGAGGSLPRGPGPIAEAAEAELELEPVHTAAYARAHAYAQPAPGMGAVAADEEAAMGDESKMGAITAAIATAHGAVSRDVSGSTAQFKDAVSHASSLRRRRAGDAANDEVEDGADGVSRASGSIAARSRRTLASDAGGSGRSRGSSAAAADASARALARWDFVREAILDGRVAELPYRMRYSVVSATFARMFPDEFDRAIPVIDHKEVDLLLMRADQHMAQYEYAKAWEQHNLGKKLIGRTGFMGLRGEEVRLKHYHLRKVKEIMAEVEEARRRAFDTAHTPSWFVFFRTQRAAAVAAQCVLHAEDNRKFRVHPAPGPDEVNWSTLWSDYRSRDLRRNLTRPLTLLVVLFPIGIFTGGLMQLDYLLCPKHKCDELKETDPNAWQEQCFDIIQQRISWSWYCQQTDFWSQLLRRLVVGWLPSLLINLWQGMILPLAFTFVVQASRQARSLSEADRCIARYMFYFAVFNVFLGGVVGSTIIQGINSAVNSGPGEIFKLVGNYLPTSSNFFISYVMFRALVAVPLRMLWPHIGIRMYLLRRYLRFRCWTTEREKAFLMAPVSPRYGFEVGMVLLMFLITFAFAVVSPILLPMALLFFAMAWLFWRWALLYVYVRKYEGGGTMWPFIFARVMVCMAIFPLFTACVFVTKEAYIQAILLFVTVPPILIRFNSFCYFRYQVGLRASIPLEAAVTGPHARVDPWVYMPPPLMTQLPGWNPDWPKCWQGWNMPLMYV